MKKKEIKPISFKEENLQEGVQLQKKTVQHASMRGSGSGESKKDKNFGSGRGVITTSYGGKWDASCSFYWEASLEYVKVMEMNVVTSVKINISDIRVSCEGVSSGVKKDGKYYESFNQGFIIKSCNDSKYSESGINDMELSATSGELEFKTAITEYNKDGAVISSGIRVEKKRISVKFYFNINDFIPEIRLWTCDIS